MASAIVFDFDGVLADSEILANEVLAEIVSELGRPTTLDDALNKYMGKRFHEVMVAISADIGKELPPGFADAFQARTLERFRKDLVLIEGAREYIDAFPNTPRCIASSSSPDRLAFCLNLLDLTEAFTSRVFSASNVARGKPYPDIFLFAAKRMQVAPADCIVIEDSVGGVQAGVAAGATVIGLLAAGHIRDGHHARLKDAGAQHVVQSFAEAERITRSLLT